MKQVLKILLYIVGAFLLLVLGNLISDGCDYLRIYYQKVYLDPEMKVYHYKHGCYHYLRGETVTLKKAEKMGYTSCPECEKELDFLNDLESGLPTESDPRW